MFRRSVAHIFGKGVQSKPASRTAHAAILVVAASLVLTTATPALRASAEPGPEQIANGGFDNELNGWNAYPNASLVDGRGCIDVPAGTAAYQAGIEQEVPMVEGETYAFSYEALTSPATAANVKIVIQGGPEINYAEFLPGKKDKLNPEPASFDYTFTANRDYAGAKVAFQQDIVNEAAYRLCIDNVSLTGGAEAEPYVPDTGPAVRVNQVGYLPDGPKQATVVAEATTPQPWVLRDGQGKTVRTGETRPRGVEDSAGVNVHTIAFDSFNRVGAGYTLSVGDQTSYPFKIAADLYADLREQSKTFYYTNRSGLAIDDELAPGYGRKAGHVQVAPNKGDKAVPCLPLDDPSQALYDEPWTCKGTRDLTGGWYDAGDHGKYVVNAGISVSQLMAEYERTLTGRADPAAYADGTLSIPEADNGVPDLLDEVRWELDWMLKMQVPTGQEYAGMANHKMSDADWTGLPLAPAEDPQPRMLFRPSTAATLNLAASAAQGARLFSDVDSRYAASLLRASRTAYLAAKKTPDLYAPAADSAVDPNPGSGPYEDDDVSDEFYWAAAELYLSTGRPTYRDDVMASEQHTATVFGDGGFDWQSVGGFARLELATVPSKLPDADRVKASVTKAADRYLAIQRGEHFGQAYSPKDGNWTWGSNSAVLNNMQVIGTAYDLSGERKYADAVLRSADYIFGRNALNNSYVTGWGSTYSNNQHSRWYAASLDPRLPHPPKGTVAGGPNSTAATTGDPVAEGTLPGCVDQFCYVDEIGAWSVNEITINWNSALSWTSGFLVSLEER